MKRRVLPPTYFLTSLLVMVWLHWTLPIYRFWTFPISLIGLIPIVLGVVINLVADRQFQRYRTTIKPFERSAALVTDFPFSLSRNPMYLGITGMLVGVAFLLGTVSSLLPAVLFPLLMGRLFIPTEEAMLAQAFGDEWVRYRTSVRRWI